MSGTVSPPPAPGRGRGAIAISFVAQLTFFLALAAAAAIAWFKSDLNLLIAMCGVAATNATTIINYWVGSSSGSDRKTELLAPKGPTP